MFSPRVEICILGPLQARRDGNLLDLGPWKQQIVLAALLCHANSPVPIASLNDALWAQSPPRTARKNIQVYVSALRGLLGPAASSPRISHQVGGYVIHADVAELDALSFYQQVRG